MLSFDETEDSERLIEVKATGLGKYFPFYVTRNELRCSEGVEKPFHLYRVFNRCEFNGNCRTLVNLRRAFAVMSLRLYTMDIEFGKANRRHFLMAATHPNLSRQVLWLVQVEREPK